MQKRLTYSSSQSLPAKSREYAEDIAAALEAQEESGQLKTKRLREYTIQSHSSMPPNNTYINFERFASVVQDISLVEIGLEDVAQKRECLQGDVEALLSIYSEKEARYKEESESIRKELSQVRYEFRKAEALRRSLRDDLKMTDAGLTSISRRYLTREEHLSSLRQQLNAELHWMQEVIESLNGDAGNEVGFSLNTEQLGD
ncbi:death-associated protein kinase 3-like [Triplophysa dalaica]|uniref:death-associated protein kinase 3-like n=1 Tax=Triplophysa dalaica TaxID=1582913 RepID=UPI0024DF4702|nr:death-associated protein kinase 3-like [Triplophysa dalaica]